MIDYSTQDPCEPHAGAKSLVVCKLLEPRRNKPFGVRGRPHSIGKPGVPLPPEFPVGIDELKKLVPMVTLNETQLGLFVNF